MRERLRKLDGCLAELEDALERGEVVLTTTLVARLAPVMGALEPGIAITAAQELVFREQEMLLAKHWAPGRPEGGELASLIGAFEPHIAITGAQELACREQEALLVQASPVTLTAKEARLLTDRIRSRAQNLCELVFRAHSGRAWVALGYQSWEDYVREEFNLSRSRAYELVDQGRVLQVLSAAANTELGAGVSPYAVREIKRYVPELAEEIRARVGAGVSSKEAREIVLQLVQDKRRAIVDSRKKGAQREAEPQSTRLSTFVRPNNRSPEALADVIFYLISLPAPSLVLKRTTGSATYDKTQVSRALSWLTEFAEQIGAIPASAPARQAG